MFDDTPPQRTPKLPRPPSFEQPATRERIAEGLSTIAMYKNPSSHPHPEAAFLVSTSPQQAARAFGLRPRNLNGSSCHVYEGVRKHSMSNIDLLQIDAEGSDFDVLKTRFIQKPVL
jgi:hypothetical protein